MDFVFHHPIVKAFAAGSFSGTFSTILFQPLDLVKTRLQNPAANTISSVIHQSKYNNGMIPIVINVIQREHIRGLWRGITPSITRCVPGVGIYFCTLDILKRTYLKGGKRCAKPLESVLLGATSRCVAGVLLIPVTVVKTRYESGVYAYSGVAQAMRRIYRSEGVRGLTCGLTATLARDAPFSGLYLMFYTYNKNAVSAAFRDDSCVDSSPVHFVCGIGAGVLASVVTQPADVIKTKMQLHPQRFSSVPSVIFYVYDTYGFRGYFKGLAPRLLRRTLMAAMAWTVYERLSKTLGL